MSNTSIGILTVVLIGIFYVGFHVTMAMEKSVSNLKVLAITDAEENPNRVINFIIPGLLRAPQSAFLRLAEEMVGDVIFVDLNGIFFRSKNIASQLTEYAVRNGYQDIRIFAVSIGDKIARRMKNDAGKIERKRIRRMVSYDINPCANKNSVKARFRVALYAGVPVLAITAFALGPLSYLNIIPGDHGTKADKNRHSLVEIASQLIAISFENTGKFRLGSNLVLSKSDALLNNAAIAKDAGSEIDHLGPNIIMIPGGHADIINYGGFYLEALAAFEAFDDDY